MSNPFIQRVSIGRAPVRVWLCALAAAFAASDASGVQITRDIPYTSPGSWPVGYTRLDLYTPDGGSAPGVVTILDIHAGSYSGGDKRDDGPVCSRLADRGFNVISINYSLAGVGQPSFPQAIRDVKAAIRWVRTEGQTLGLSPQIVVMGTSAGSTIGVAAAYSVGVPELELLPAPPDGGYEAEAVIAIYGRYDLVWDGLAHGSPGPLRVYLGGPISDPIYGPSYTGAAAISYVGSCTPPTYLLHGDIDWLVPYQHSVRLAGALSDAGVFNILHLVPGGNHGTGILGDPDYIANQVTTAIAQLLANPSPPCGGTNPGSPPVNDLCVNAIDVAPGQSLAGTTLGASGTQTTLCASGTDTRDVWYRIVPALTRQYTFDTIVPSPAFASTLSIYEGCSTDISTFACDRDSGGPWCARVRATLAAGRAYYVRVAGNNGSAGPFQFNVGQPEPASSPPENDSCVGAIAVGLGSHFGTTLGAGQTIEGCGINDHDDVWYTFTVPLDGVFRFDTFGSTVLGDTTLAIRAGCEGPLVVCNDDAPNAALNSLIDHPCMVGEEVLIRIAGNNGTSGPFRLNIERLPGANEGACCLAAGECDIRAALDCTAGVWRDGQPCSAAPCLPPPPLGACCAGALCSVVSDAASCAGSFAGPGAVCGEPGNPIACCRANINQVGGLTVQDLFDFLSAYFGGNPLADFNASGANTVQDVFDFLGAYFQGCS
ncbi:MAG: alpha/beta hydrolase [Phycisphaerales bacterium]|nr:alpha/beta hydrolase [Phycisphaerales bacterium]